MSMFLEIERWLKEKMDDSLFQHSVEVSRLAAELARRYGEDEEKAQLAGLIHDCGKVYSSKEMLGFAKSFEFEIDAVEKVNPLILHAKIGPEIFQQKFGKIHKSVRSAVSLHTTGNANMKLLDKIIYVADSLEPNRHYPGLIQIREKVRWDLDYTLHLIIQRKIQVTMESRKPVHPDSIAAWNWILAIVKNKRL